ncbi:MAG TPA: DUF5667 domain-containing protein [Candidatus Limnocylindria bacterium]|nr:DUF5667 domain-containing protein [Candidatus Limnocylindria bacterium]
MKEQDTAALDAFAREIAGYGRLAAPPALRARLRGALLAAPAVLPHRPSGFGARLLSLRPVLAGIVVLALVAGAGGSAAASSLPGDPAFAVKRAVEAAQVALASDDATRLDVLVAQADRRLGDLQTIATTRPAALATATDEYEGAVSRLDAALTNTLAQAPTAARAAAVARATAASAEHIAELQALAARLPAQAQPGIQRAIEAQQAVHGKSGNAPGRNGNPGRPQTPGASGVPGRPSDLPGGPPPGRAGPPTGVPGRP